MNEVTWLDIFSVDSFREIPNVRDNVSTALQSQYSHSLIYRGINKAIHDNRPEKKLPDRLGSLHQNGTSDRIAGLFEGPSL